MATNGILKFQGTNKATFVGATSNVVIDTVKSSLGIGVDVDGPTSNLHVVGNAYVSTELTVGGTVTATTFSGSGSGLTALPAAEITGTLAVANGGTGVTGSTGTGDVVLSIAPAFSGDVAFDTNTLFVDSTDNRVGVGTADPGTALEVFSTSGTQMTLRSDSRYSTIFAVDDTGSSFFGNDRGAIRFTTGGDTSGSGASEKMRILANGNVGIGTDSPATPFHINKLTATTNPKAHTTTEFIRIRGDKVIGQTYAISGGIKLGGETGGTATADGRMEFYVNDGAGVSNDYGDIPDKLVMCMRGDGNVGIGTTNPLTIFDTHGTSRISAAYPRFDFYTTTSRSTDAWGNSTGAAGDYRIYANGDASDGTKRSLNFDYGQNSVHTSRMVINAAGNVGIGTASPIAALDIDAGPENDTVPALSIRGGLFSESDLYVLNTYSNSTAGGVGYAAKVIGVNIKNKVETDNKIQIRSNTGGLTCGSAMYLGSDDSISGVFGILTGDGAVGTTLTEKLTVRASGNVGIGTSSPEAQLHIGPKDNDHIYLASSNNDYGWKIDTDDQGAGDVPFRIIKRTNDVDTTILTIKNQYGNVGIGTTDPQRSLHVKSTTGIMVEDNAKTSAIYVDNVAQGEVGDVYSYILNAPRPGTTGSGAVHFINGSGRTVDGGASTYTIRNDSGKLRLGGTSGDTILEGNVTASIQNSTRLFSVGGWKTKTWSGNMAGSGANTNINIINMVSSGTSGQRGEITGELTVMVNRAGANQQRALYKVWLNQSKWGSTWYGSTVVLSSSQTGWTGITSVAMTGGSGTDNNIGVRIIGNTNTTGQYYIKFEGPLYVPT